MTREALHHSLSWTCQGHCQHTMQNVSNDLGIGTLFFTTSTMVRMSVITELVPVHSWSLASVQLADRDMRVGSFVMCISRVIFAVRIRHERFHQLRLCLLQQSLCFFWLLLGGFLACHVVWIVVVSVSAFLKETDPICTSAEVFDCSNPRRSYPSGRVAQGASVHTPVLHHQTVLMFSKYRQMSLFFFWSRNALIASRRFINIWTVLLARMSLHTNQRTKPCMF